MNQHNITDWPHHLEFCLFVCLFWNVDCFFMVPSLFLDIEINMRSKQLKAATVESIDQLYLLWAAEEPVAVCVLLVSVSCSRSGVLWIYRLRQNIKTRPSQNRKSKFSLPATIWTLAWASPEWSALYHPKGSHHHPVTSYQQLHSSCQSRLKWFCRQCGSPAPPSEGEE